MSQIESGVPVSTGHRLSGFVLVSTLRAIFTSISKSMEQSKFSAASANSPSRGGWCRMVCCRQLWIQVLLPRYTEICRSGVQQLRKKGSLLWRYIRALEDEVPPGISDETAEQDGSIISWYSLRARLRVLEAGRACLFWVPLALFREHPGQSVKFYELRTACPPRDRRAHSAQRKF